MLDKLFFTPADLSHLPMSEETAKYAVKKARVACWLQFVAALVIMLLLRWIVDSSFGPAAEIFEILWAISFFLLLWPAGTLWFHYKSSAELLEGISNFDPIHDNPSDFWDRNEAIFPYFKSPL